MNKNLEKLAIVLAVVLVSLFAAAERAKADAQFFVLHASPADGGIQPGALYSAGEFIFVPNGAGIVLMDKEGKRYILNGLIAVAAEESALAAYRYTEDEKDGRSIVESLFNLGGDEVLAAGRNVIEAEGEAKRDLPALELQLALLPHYRNGERFCVVGNKLTVRRRSPLGEETVQVTGEGRQRSKILKPGTREATFDNFELGPDGTIGVTTRDGETSIRAIRIDEAILSRDKVNIAAAFAQRGCTLQALLATDK